MHDINETSGKLHYCDMVIFIISKMYRIFMLLYTCMIHTHLPMVFGLYLTNSFRGFYITSAVEQRFSTLLRYSHVKTDFTHSIPKHTTTNVETELKYTFGLRAKKCFDCVEILLLVWFTLDSVSSGQQILHVGNEDLFLAQGNKWSWLFLPPPSRDLSAILGY